MIEPILKLFKALNSDDSPYQLAWGIVFGCLIGLSPFFSVHNLVLFLLVCILRINFSAFVVSFVGFTALAWAVDPYAHQLGEWLLLHPDLQTTWSAMYQIDLLRLTRFNHTITLGALVIGLIVMLPLLFLSKLLVDRYRITIRTHLEKLKIVQLIKASKIFMLYQSLS